MLYVFQTKMPYRHPDALYNKRKASSLGLSLDQFIDLYEDEKPDEIVTVFSIEMNVFIGVISPFSPDYQIRVSHDIKKCILHTENELAMVKGIFRQKGVKYKLFQVGEKNSLIALTEEKTISYEEESFSNSLN